MQEEIYTPGKVAEILDVKVTTVRRFIREGKLKAHKVGRQWRIMQGDLELFLGRELKPGPPASGGEGTSSDPERVKMRVSAVVDVLVAGPDEAMRISNSILAVLNQKDPAYGEVRYDHVYYVAEKKARYIFWGGARFIGEMLTMLDRIST